VSSSLPPPQPGSNFREQYLLFRRKKEELGCPSFLWNFAYFSVQVMIYCGVVVDLMIDATINFGVYIVVFLIYLFPYGIAFETELATLELLLCNYSTM